MQADTSQFERLVNGDTSHILNEMLNDEIAIMQLNKAFNDKWISCDVDGTTLYMGGYEHIAKAIPLRMPVYDFGAAYGFQSWHYRKHKKYIAIQPHIPYADFEFRTDNSIWYKGTAQQFFKDFSVEEDAFAIVNAVPDPEVAELVKKHFKYMYIMYV